MTWIGRPACSATVTAASKNSGVTKKTLAAESLRMNAISGTARRELIGAKHARALATPKKISYQASEGRPSQATRSPGFTPACCSRPATRSERRSSSA